MPDSKENKVTQDRREQKVRKEYLDQWDHKDQEAPRGHKARKVRKAKLDQLVRRETKDLRELLD
jgi:hypothetical protein